MPVLTDRTDIARARELIKMNHYTRSVPSGKTWWYAFMEAVVAFSIPPNPYISRALLGTDNQVLELSRLWAPDGHAPNLLSQAVSAAFRALVEPNGYAAAVSYADPSAGHEGFVYRACSWVYLGPAAETRSYRSPEGDIVSRRAFHSGSRALRKAEILALGYVELKARPKERYARGATRQARRMLAELERPYG